ncbi:protein unc-93 homolog B1 [Spea bombifrons]|uniref:protein unc-93 homolog B1 n=1 Tax=Spea bombifrons TaxID=233779 RepID=UPI00234BB1BB|nr:protein unc-93 homolog B1 [Spea bombifrons]XP_053306537.1 protein unc-93 homolog B1 [Spea bombifrons]
MAQVYHDASINGVAADGAGVLQLADDTPVLDGANAQVEEFLGERADDDEEAEEKRYYRRKRLLTVKSVVFASLGTAIIYGVYLGLLQMQLILHYDETYRDVKYGNMGLQDIDNKMLMGINVTPIAALLYTPILIRFFGTKWMLFLSSGIYALFVSTNYWERYYTLVPSATVIGVMIVPFWASIGNYITRMAQKYYEFVNYKEQNVKEQNKLPRGASHKYIIIFQSIFYSIFHISFVLSQFPVFFFLSNYLYSYNHTLHSVNECGASIMHGILPKFNVTVLHTLPPSLSLIYVESTLMGAALLSMILILALCGSAYRPTEEIDLRSIGWGNIFQLPFKHARDYRLRCLAPYFLYSGFEVLFACTGFALCYGVCALGLETLPYLITAYGLSSSVSSFFALSMLHLPRQVPLVGGALLHSCILIGLFFWSPTPKLLSQGPILYIVAVLWGMGSAMNKTGLSIIIGMFYEDKERQDFVFTIYHWLQAFAIFIVYLWSWLPMKAKLAIMLSSALVSILSYLWMEHKLRNKVPYRVPKIPAPRHKVKGYRYLEEENSDESGSDGESEQSKGEESDADENGREPIRQRCRNSNKEQCYEQAVEEE